jgi:hypothetical protein
MKATPLRSPALPWLEAVLLVAIIGATMYASLIQRSGLTEPDTLFHFKLAQMILQDGPWVDIPWLPFSVLGERGPDHQWLWHVALAPFALIADPVHAIAVAAAVTCAAVAVAVHFVARRFDTPLPLVTALLSVSLYASLPERLTRLRSENLACILLVLALVFMARRQRVALFVLSFVFMASYHGAVLLLPMVAVYTLASFMKHRPQPLHNGVAVLAGLTAGLLLSPWFPENIDYLLFHTLFKLGSENADLIGTEWMAPSARHLWVLASSTTFLLLVSATAFAVSKWRFDRSLQLGEETVASMLMTALLAAMHLTSYRYGVYYGLFAVLCSALLWRDSQVRISRPAIAIAAGCAAVIGACALFAVKAHAMLEVPVQARTMTRYARMADHLRTRTAPGDIVYNVTWDSFSYLVWQAPQLRFVAGLDGNYLAYGDPERFRIWYALLQGAPIEGDLSKVLQQTFNTKWVIVPRSKHLDAVAMRIIDGGDAATAVLNGDGWLIRLGP